MLKLLSESLTPKTEKKNCLKELEDQLGDKKESFNCFKNELIERFNEYKKLTITDWIAKLYGIETDITPKFKLNDEVMIKSHKKKFLCLSHNNHNLKYSQQLKYFIKEQLEKDKDSDKDDDKIIKGKIVDSSYDNTIFLVEFDNNNIYWIHQDDIKKINTEIISGGSYQKNNSKKIRYILIRKKKLIKKHKQSLKNNNKYLGPFKLLKTVDLSGPLIFNFHNGGGEQLEITPSNLKIEKKYNLPFIDVTDLENNYKFIIYMFIQTSKLLAQNSLVKLIYFGQINIIRKFISTFSQIIKAINLLQSSKDGQKYQKEFFLLTTPLCISTEFLISPRLVDKLKDQTRKITNLIGIDLLTVISDYILNLIQSMTDMIVKVCTIRAEMIKNK